jgi:L-rhamnose isomerase/sugar isomerase
MTNLGDEQVLKSLDAFEIELPSWGFADTGTRFGKFHQPASASTTAEKLHDAGLVHKLTGACPMVAVHVLWDFDDPTDAAAIRETVGLAEQNGIRIGSINPNVFQDQSYKLGSFCAPDPEVRAAAMQHTLDCVKLGAAVNSQALSLWLADGTNYPGQDNMRRRKRDLQSALAKIHDEMSQDWQHATLLVEYKPFEPAFYHTDIADWGMAAFFCQHAGPNAKVLVDTGHHLPGCNIEHIVSFLLDEGLLGGFHFNDRKYADDDLTLGSIDPYAVFRIFNAVAQHEHDTQQPTTIAYMVDQSHNLKPKLEAMVQTVCEAQKLYLKAQLVERDALAFAQDKGDIVQAETLLRAAYEQDVTPLLASWRASRGLDSDPLQTLRNSGVVEQLAVEREKARLERGETSSASYA